MGVDREDFSDAANWQTPQELPDLRRVGIVALDTETRRRSTTCVRAPTAPRPPQTQFCRSSPTLN